MRLFFFPFWILSLTTVLGQTNGTIRIQKEIAPEHKIVRFAGQETGSLELRGFLLDKCLEANVGIIEKFEIIIEDDKGNWAHIKTDSSCLCGENYELLEKLGNGSHLEFMNIMGIDQDGNEIIYPGMKFVIRKKKLKLD